MTPPCETAGRLMDAYTAKSMDAWIKAHVPVEAQDRTIDLMLALLYEYPELVGDDVDKARTWTEIRMLAERRGA